MPWPDPLGGCEIEPSLYAADFLCLREGLAALFAAGARTFHFDVGDGHFVPPVTIGPVVLESIAPFVHERGGVLDCHLMVERPERHLEAISAAGGDSVTVHLETGGDLPGLAGRARELGLGVGLAFNPESAPEAAAEAAPPFDLVLCMSIHPGYSGRPFMTEALGRVRRLRELLPGQPIQVDGGVGEANVAPLRDAGATLLVAGTSVYGRPDPAAAYRALAAAAARA